MTQAQMGMKNQRIRPKDFPDVTRNRKAFTILVRNEIFRFVKSLAAKDYEAVLAILEGVPESVPESGPDSESNSEPNSEIEEPQWTLDRLADCMQDYYDSEHLKMRTDTEARSAKFTLIEYREQEQQWEIQQILVDPDGHNDWAIDFSLNIEHSRHISKPALKLVKIGPLG